MDDIKEPLETPAAGEGKVRGKGKGQGKGKGAKGEHVVNRQKLLTSVTEKTGLPKSKAIAAMDAVFEIVTQSLKDGNEVRVLNFGSFVVSKRKAGKGRDPRSGAEIDVPQSKSVRFRPSKSLRETLGGAASAGQSEAEG